MKLVVSLSLFDNYKELWEKKESDRKDYCINP